MMINCRTYTYLLDSAEICLSAEHWECQRQWNAHNICRSSHASLSISVSPNRKRERGSRCGLSVHFSLVSFDLPGDVRRPSLSLSSCAPSSPSSGLRCHESHAKVATNKTSIPHPHSEGEHSQHMRTHKALSSSSSSPSNHNRSAALCLCVCVYYVYMEGI